MYESLSTFTSLERDWNLALLQSKTLIINIYYNTKMGESTSKFDFERIVPVFLREPSRSIFCANRPGRIVPGRNWFLRETSRNRRFASIFHPSRFAPNTLDVSPPIPFPP